MNRILLTIPWIILIGLLFVSCEEEIELDVKGGKDKPVVEGYIEPGFPPVLFLTESSPYFSSVSINKIEKGFIHGAKVYVMNGRDTVRLREYHTSDLPQPIIDSIGNLVGGPFENISFSVYLDTSFQMTGEVGETYRLKVKTGDKTLNASTTLQPRVPLDSVFFRPHPEREDLVTVMATYTDPPGRKNYFRFFTSRNGGPFYPGYFNSLFDDNTIVQVEGQSINFPIERGYNRNQEVELETYSFFERGDTVTVRWAQIDEAGYNFWSTLEFDFRNTGNPFIAPTRINSNVKGGLGIWGAYSSTFHTVVIPE